MTALAAEGATVGVSGGSTDAALAVCVSAIECTGEAAAASEVATGLGGVGDCAHKIPAQHTNAQLNQRLRAASIVLEAGRDIAYTTPLHLCSPLCNFGLQFDITNVPTARTVRFKLLPDSKSQLRKPQATNLIGGSGPDHQPRVVILKFE